MKKCKSEKYTGVGCLIIFGCQSIVERPLKMGDESRTKKNPQTEAFHAAASPQKK